MGRKIEALTMVAMTKVAHVMSAPRSPQWTIPDLVDATGLERPEVVKALNHLDARKLVARLNHGLYAWRVR